ncbi:unnamed protein product [Ixodes pacificus]
MRTSASQRFGDVNQRTPTRAFSLPGVVPMMSQDHLLKLDAVLSSEQMRALLQDAGGPHSHSDKLDFDVLGNVGGAEDGSHPLAAIEDSLHDLENLVGTLFFAHASHSFTPSLFNQ